MRLSDDELLMLSYFRETIDDKHPDAHACRLKLRCCFVYAPLYSWPYDVRKEYMAYITKIGHVSQACRRARWRLEREPPPSPPPLPPPPPPPPSSPPSPPPPSSPLLPPPPSSPPLPAPPSFSGLHTTSRRRRLSHTCPHPAVHRNEEVLLVEHLQEIRDGKSDDTWLNNRFAPGVLQRTPASLNRTMEIESDHPYGPGEPDTRASAVQPPSHAPSRNPLLLFARHLMFPSPRCCDQALRTKFASRVPNTSQLSGMRRRTRRRAMTTSSSSKT